MPYLLRKLMLRRTARSDSHLVQFASPRRGFAVSRATLTGATRNDDITESEDAEWVYPIYPSERVKEKKSVFLAHASTLPSPAALTSFLDHLAAQPSLKRATHCMHAYRVIPDAAHPEKKILGQHDGGEKGSGERLSRLLEVLECENVVVVVSRWYGGVKLGSDRWKMISSVAKDALGKGNFIKEKTSTVPPNKSTLDKKKKKR